MSFMPFMPSPMRAGQRLVYRAYPKSILAISPLRYKVLPQLSQVKTKLSIRPVSSEAGDFHSGHIEAGPNEGIFFFDNVFPLKLRWLLRFSFHGETHLQRLSHPSVAAFDPTRLLQKAIPETSSIKIGDIIPRMKDGGAFVRFSHDETTSSQDVEQKLRDYLKKQPIRPWFNPFQHARARLVRGRPWVEDLYRPPSCELKVEFVPQGSNEPVELSQEQVYSILRPYGKLRQISSQPQDSKVFPRYALVTFASTKRGIMAKNCLHGLEVKSENGSTLPVKLKMSYESKQKSNWIRDWIFNHPRIFLPLLAAFTTIFAVNVFDPVRTFNIKAHITGVFHIKDNPLYRWFASRAENILTFGRSRSQEPGMHAIWDDRKDVIDQIERWLMETADNFIVVQGPRGSGKKELVVDMALKDRKDKLIIDCKAIQEARGDAATIKALAQQVGFRPLFSWMNSISGLIDLAAQSATGMKTGFSETLDGQLNKILNSTASALQQIGLEERKKDDADADLSSDAYLESHPERRPVVVIDNFLHKSQESGVVYDKLAEWAANVSTANIAHVIFLTTDVSYSKALSKALPDRVFRQLSLGDCSPEVAKRFVLSHLESAMGDQPESEGHRALNLLPGEKDNSKNQVKLTEAQKQRDLAELDESLGYLGGRLTDLEFLARRIKAGESPQTAVQEVIDQSASEILKMYIIGGDKVVSASTIGSSGAPQRLWTPEQAWVLIKALAEATPSGEAAWQGKKDSRESDAGSLRYNEIIMHEAFKGSSNADAVLQSLEQAELITIVTYNGRPRAIRPGKPVYLAAFKLLTRDKVLAARLDLALVNDSMKNLLAGIEKNEKELQLLATLPKQPGELVERERYLLAGLFANQRKIEELERKAASLKKVLATDF